MRLDDLTSDDAVLEEIGRRIAALRVERRLTQDELAEAAGVGRTTVQKIERGRTVQLVSLLKVLRRLERLDRLDAALALPPPSPLAELERQGRRPRRVRHPARDDRQPAAGEPWSWGDDPPGEDP